MTFFKVGNLSRYIILPISNFNKNLLHFKQTPNLKVGQFSTTYTYYNTIMDDDIPIVAMSKHIVVNTITAAEDYLRMIQPSPSAVPVYETNTYYSTVDFSKTINDDEETKVINTQDVITQVIVTESLPHGKPTSQFIDQFEDELSPSDSGSESEEQNYIRKTNAIDVSPTRIDQKPAGNTEIPLHLYATKTYLTTFTYFTTLLQNVAGNDGEISTTVDSHTRVIENVITESIASSLIPTNILSSINKNLFDGEKNDLKTKIVLTNGQKLEITAANILKPVDYATATKLSAVESNDLDVAANDVVPASILLPTEEAENCIPEPVESEENIVAQQPLIQFPSNNARPKPVSSNTGSGSLKIPSLLNGISMPSFSALGPVINAMAGLLQNNFGSPSLTRLQPSAPLNQHLPPSRGRPASLEHEKLPQPLPLFSQESQDLILSQTDGKNTRPLYIPVRGDPNHSGSAETRYYQNHMMGSGIAISPGDVITANSDVIVGKPAVIGPKLPSNSNDAVEIAGMKAPPPFVPLKTPQRPSSFIKDIKSNGNINHVTIKKGDDYIGPVPPKENQSPPQQHKPIPLTSFSRQPVPKNLQKIRPVNPMRTNENSGQKTPQINKILQKPRPTQETQNINHYVKINQQANSQKQQFANVRNPNLNFRDQEPPRHQDPLKANHNSFRNPQPHGHLVHHQIHQPQKQNQNVRFSIQRHPQNSANINNKPANIAANIIEIQKIPEVYSTDLPVITVDNQHHFKLSSDSQIITHELPEILDKPTRGQPLLVDIQPSQVANVVIPHGSSSILVFGGVHKAHKAGQYFNDPSPHGNGEVGIKSVNLLADVEPAQNMNIGQKVPDDVKDNIIVASNHVPYPVNSPAFSVLLGSSLNPTISRPPDFIHHSVNVAPSSVVRFHPDPTDNYYRPNNQQKAYLDQQLRQKQIDNQKRQEIMHHQKMVEQQQRKEIQEQQHLKQIELDRKREFERQKQNEYEQRQKQIEQRQQEIEHQKRINELKAHHELKLRQPYDIEQKYEQDITLKQHQPAINYNVRPQNLIVSHGNSIRQGLPGNQDSGFLILSSDYGNKISNQGNQLSQAPGPFIALPALKQTKAPQLQQFDNEAEGDGEVVQESINRPKLPSGENHESVEEDDVKVPEEYDNFVYHKIAALSTLIPDPPSTTTEEFSISTTQKPLNKSTEATTKRSSYVPIPPVRINPTTERYSPIYKPKPYPNLQFDNLPLSVNDLQPTNRPNSIMYQRIPFIGAQFKPNYNVQTGNSLSQSMKPPVPPKISRRPTTPFYRTTFKISMPINPMPDDTNVINNLQTEEPFNPKYTEDVPTKPSLTTQASSLKTSKVNSHKPAKQPETTTETEARTTRTDLNLGEIETKDRNKTFSIDDTSDIFDSKETANPLNNDFVKNNNEMDDMDLMPPSIRKPYHTIVRLPEATTLKSNGIRLEISTINLEKMKPPAPAQWPPKSHIPNLQEIVDIKPQAKVPNNNYFDSFKTKPSYVSIQRQTLDRLPSTTQVPYKAFNNTKENSTTFSPIVGTRFTTKQPENKSESLDIVLHLKQGENQDILKSEDIIIGSVEAVNNEQIVKPSINATPVLNTESTGKISTRPTNYSSVSISSSVGKGTSLKGERLEPSRANGEERLQQNRTKAFSEPIKVSTLIITNTKTITLSRTKTEVINRSHGLPITTTRVQTATVFETVTETETLLRPTTVTNIRPTSTYNSIIRETAHPTTTEQIIEGFVSDEDIEEFIINYDDNRNDTTIKRVISREDTKNSSENESIFVVMTDKKKGGVFNIDSSIINPSMYNQTIPNEIDDVSRGEEETNDGADHILLGGILIASPPQLNKSQQGAAVSSHCFPDCKTSKNEYCHRVFGQMRCDCRPGFARMFPDRPCKRM